MDTLMDTSMDISMGTLPVLWSLVLVFQLLLLLNHWLG